MRIINASYLILITLYFAGCVVHKHYHTDSFFEKYSEEEIHTLIIIDYIMHTRNECSDCNFFVNGVLKFKPESFSQHDGSKWNNVVVDISRTINLGINGFEITNFGDIYFTTLDVIDVDYEFTPLILDKDNSTITGEVRFKDDRYIFLYKVFNDRFLLSLNFIDY